MGFSKKTKALGLVQIAIVMLSISVIFLLLPCQLCAQEREGEQFPNDSLSVGQSFDDRYRSVVWSGSADTGKINRVWGMTPS